MTTRIEYVALDQVKRWPRNPKKHDLPAVIKSIERFGFVAPLIVDEGTGRLVAGHGRLEALLSMLDASPAQPVPVGLIADEAGWQVPVVRGITFADANAAEAYLLADNRMVELGGWDTEALATMLGQLEGEGLLEGTGFGSDDLENLMAQLGGGVLDAEPFMGGHAETPEEAQARADREMADARGGRPGDAREVYLLFSHEEHERFIELVEYAKQELDTSTIAATVLAVLEERTDTGEGFKS